MSTPLAWLRMEHKLDLILHALQNTDNCMIRAQGLPQLSEYGTDRCPVCAQPINLSIDAINETYTRGCGCMPACKLVPGISSVMIPTPSTPSTNTESPDAPEQSPES